MLFNLLLLLSLYLPFQLALNPATDVDLASVRIFILILFFIWLAEGLRKKRIIIGKNMQTVLLISFIFLNLISIFMALNINWALRKFLYLISIFPVYFIVSDIINSENKILKLLKYLTLSGTVAALVGIMQFFSQFIFGLDFVYKNWAQFATIPFLGENFGAEVLKNTSWLVNISGHTYLRAISVFPDPHMFSFYLGMLLPIAAGLFFVGRKKIWIAASVIIFVADILTFSRGGYLALVGGILFLFFISWSGLKSGYKMAILALAATTALIIFIPNPVSSRFFSSFNLEEGSNSGRIAMWQAAENMIAKRPITGVGLGNFSLQVDPLAPYRNSIYAHNAYLDIAAETGVANGLVFAGLLIFAILAFIGAGKRNIIYLSLATSLIVFSVHSLVDTAIYSPVVLALLSIIIGLSNVKLDEENI